MLLILLPLLIVGSVNLLAIPSYIKPCSLSDIEFEKCALATAHNYVQQLRKGDENLKILPIASLDFPIMHFNNTRGDITINVTKAVIRGLALTKFQKIRKDPTKNKIEVIAVFPAPSISGDFSIAAVIGDKTINGKGPGILSFENYTYEVTFVWNIIKRDGIDYTNIIETVTNYDIKHASLDIQLEPGNNLQEVFNNNWAYIIKELSPAFNFYAEKIFLYFTHTLFNTVPYNDIFLI